MLPSAMLLLAAAPIVVRPGGSITVTVDARVATRLLLDGLPASRALVLRVMAVRLLGSTPVPGWQIDGAAGRARRIDVPLAVPVRGVLAAVRVDGLDAGAVSGGVEIAAAAGGRAIEL